MCMSHPWFKRYSHFGKTGADHSSPSLTFTGTLLLGRHQSNMILKNRMFGALSHVHHLSLGSSGFQHSAHSPLALLLSKTLNRIKSNYEIYQT